MKRVLTLATASAVLATSVLAVPARSVVLPGADISSITDVKSGLRPTLKTDGKNSLYEDLTGKTIRSTNPSIKEKQRRAPSRITAQGDELYGYLLVSDDDEYEPGLYEFQEEGYEMKWADEDYYDSEEKLMSCWYDDGKIKGYKLRIVAGSPFYYAYCEYDFETGEILENNVVDLEVPVQSFMRYNGCYDPKSDIIYAFGYVAQSNGSFKYGLAKASGSDPLTATLIRGLDTALPDTPRSMTFNTEDNMLYAIDANSQFLRINPSDGSIEVCYTLDLEKEVKYVSGLYYNPIKKIYYWNPNFSDGSSAMATINPADGKVNIYEEFENSEEFISLFSTKELANPARPEKPEFKSIDFKNGATSGTVTYTLPSKTFDGSMLSGNLTWHAFLDGVEKSTGTAAAGSDVTVTFGNVGDGMHAFALAVSKGEEMSRRTSIRQYIGNDTPVMPTHVILTRTSLSWAPVTEGIHGAYIDQSKMTYDVYLNDEHLGLTSATSVPVNIPTTGELTGYKATVYAVCNGHTSKPTLSNNIVSGDPVNLPINIVPTAEQFNMMTQYYSNLTVEQELWKFEEGDDYEEANFASGWTVEPDIDMDSWIFLPPMNITETDKFYSISFNSRLRSGQYPDETIEVLLCSDTTPDGVISTIIEGYTPSAYVYDSKSALFKVNQPGVYYIGFHSTSAPEQFGCRIKHVKVEDNNITVNSPSTPTDVVATPGQNGALSANVSFKFPTTTLSSLDIEGTALPADDLLTATITGVSETTVSGKPGETASVDINTVQGNNTLSIVISTADGYTSIPVNVNVYTGVVVPASVRNLQAKESEDMMSVTITWDAPQTGNNGGYIVPEDVTYTIYQIINDTGSSELVTLKKDLKETTFTVSVPKGTPEGAFYLGVMSNNIAGTNGYYVAVTSVLGIPLSLPIAETFDDPEMPYSTSPWLRQTPSQEYVATLGWAMLKDLDDTYAQSTSGGIVSVGKYANVKSRISTPRFSTLGKESVTLTVEAIDFANAGKIVFYGQTFDDDLMYLDEIVPTFTGETKSYEFQLPDEMLNKIWAGLMIDFEFTNRGMCFIESLKIEGKDSSGLNTVNDNATVIIAGGKGCITVSGFTGEVAVVKADGRKSAAQNVDGTATIYVENGIYIVKAGSKVAKVIVK